MEIKSGLRSGGHGLLNFHGRVTDENGQAVPGAAVVLFARYRGGVETSLGITVTDQAGSYLIPVPRPADDDGLLGFRLTAGLNHDKEKDDPERSESKDYAAWRAFREERLKSQVQYRRPHFSLARPPDGSELPFTETKAGAAVLSTAPAGDNPVRAGAGEKGKKEPSGGNTSPGQRGKGPEKERRPHVWSGNAVQTSRPYPTRR